MRRKKSKCSNMTMTPFDSMQMAHAAMGMASLMPNNNCGCSKAQTCSEDLDKTPVSAETLAQTDFNDGALF